MIAIPLIVGAVLLFAANVLLWVDSTIFESDQFTATVDDVFSEPEVQERLASVMAAEIVNSGVLQPRIEANIPENLAFATPIIESQLEPVLTEVARRILATDFADVFGDRIIRNLHDRVVAILEDDDTILRAQGDSLVLDLNEPLQRLFDRLGIQPGERLGGAVQGLIGNDGTVVLLEDATGLRQASFFVQNRELLMALLFAGSLIAFGLALVLARNKRTGVIALGYTVLLVGLATLLTVFVSNLILENSAEQRVVLRELVRALEANLRFQSVALVVLGACVVLLADQRFRRRIDWLDARAGALVAQADASIVIPIAAIGVVVLLLI